MTDAQTIIERGRERAAYEAQESYCEIIGAIAVISELDHYLTDCLRLVCKAYRVNRLDLYHILTYVFDTQRVDPTLPEVGTLVGLHNRMDHAAAMGTTDCPLVLTATGYSRECFSVLADDTDAVAFVKREAQKPSTADYRGEQGRC